MLVYWIIWFILWTAGGNLSTATLVNFEDCQLRSWKLTGDQIDMSLCRNETSKPSISCSTGLIIAGDIVVGAKPRRPECFPTRPSDNPACCKPESNDTVYSGKCLLSAKSVSAFYANVFEMLLNQCSGKTSCEISSTWTLPVMNLVYSNYSNNDYSFIQYKCEEAKLSLDICRNVEVHGEEFYLKLNSQTVTNTYDSDCACDVENLGSEATQVQMTALDIRMYVINNLENCSGAKLFIEDKQFENNNCTAVVNRVIWRGSIPPQSSVPLVLRHITGSALPTFVWLKIAGEGNSTLSVNCRGAHHPASEAASAFLIGIVVTCVTTLAVIIIIVVVCIYRWRHQFKCLRKQKQLEQPVYFEVQPTTTNVEDKPPLPPNNPSSLVPPPKPLRAAQVNYAPLGVDGVSSGGSADKPGERLSDEQYNLLLRKKSPATPGYLFGEVKKKINKFENHYARPGEKNPRGQSVVDCKYNQPDLLKS